MVRVRRRAVREARLLLPDVPELFEKVRASVGGEEGPAALGREDTFPKNVDERRGLPPMAMGGRSDGEHETVPEESFLLAAEAKTDLDASNEPGWLPQLSGVWIETATKGSITSLSSTFSFSRDMSLKRGNC